MTQQKNTIVHHIDDIVYHIDDIVRVSWHNNTNINLLGIIKNIEENGMKFLILYSNGTYQNVRKQDLQRPFNEGDHVLAFKKDTLIKPDCEQPVEAIVFKDNRNNTYDLKFSNTKNEQIKTVKGMFIQDIRKDRDSIFSVGSLVFVNWKSSGYKYYATVIKEYQETVDVIFSLDSFIEKGIPKSDLSNPFPINTKIKGNFKGLGKFYRGMISHFNHLNGSFDIIYDDDDKEFGVPIYYIQFLPPKSREWDEQEIHLIKGEIIRKKLTKISETFLYDIKNILENSGSIRTVISINSKCQTFKIKQFFDINKNNNNNNFSDKRDENNSIIKIRNYANNNNNNNNNKIENDNNSNPNNESYWTKEKCINEVNNCFNLSDFINNSPIAYHVALNNNWIGEICSNLFNGNNNSITNNNNSNNNSSNNNSSNNSSNNNSSSNKTDIHNNDNYNTVKKRKRIDNTNTSSSNNMVNTSSNDNNKAKKKIKTNYKSLENNSFPPSIETFALKETIKDFALNHVNSHIGQHTMNSLVDLIHYCGIFNNKSYISWRNKTKKFYDKKKIYSPETYYNTSTLINEYIMTILSELVESENLFKLSIGISNFKNNIDCYEKSKNVLFLISNINKFINLINAIIPPFFTQLKRVEEKNGEIISSTGFKIIKEFFQNYQQNNHVSNSNVTSFLLHVIPSYTMLLELNK